MKGLKPTFVAILAIGLLAGSPSIALAAYENETAVTINIPTENIRPGGWSQAHIRDYLRSGGTFRLESVAEPGTTAVDETWATSARSRRTTSSRQGLLLASSMG